MCGGCGSCLRIQAEHSGFNVTEEIEMKTYEVFRHIEGKPCGDPVGTVTAESLGAAQVLARQVFPCERKQWLDVFTLWESPSREYLQRMGDAEDAAGSVSVGGMAVDLGQPVEAGAEKIRTQAEQDAADLAYLRELDKLRQDAGITAAMLRDGRAKAIMLDRQISREQQPSIDKRLIESANLLCDFISTNMPPGWRLDMCMSKDEAYLTLTDSDGEEHELPTADSGVSSIRDACEVAESIEKGNK